ncbi:MAG: heme-binding protein [Gemmatimonadetes bacterium]|nr:heme-binding protein [Gemmatimonadota bacterium]
MANGLAAQAPTTKAVLSLAAAKAIAGAAQAEAERRGSTVVIAVVDDGGHLIALHRLDDTQVASVDVGIGKARTAAIFRRRSGVFEDQIKNGRLASLVLPGATPLQGGVPIFYRGKVIGAIGVSGNTPKEDEEIALAGAWDPHRADRHRRAGLQSRSLELRGGVPDAFTVGSTVIMDPVTGRCGRG